MQDLHGSMGGDVTLPAREEIERTLRQLKGVLAARVCTEGGQITEIHVVAGEGSRPKNIARDVRSYMAAALGIDVHHQKISVAVADPPGPDELTRPIPDEAMSQSNGEAPRVLFNSVNLLVEGVRSEVQVELRLNGRSLIGSSAGAPATLGTERLIAAATLAALEKVVRQDVRLLSGDLTFTRVGPGEAVIVEVVLVKPRSEERLVGACRVQQDRHRCVVFAVLDAINRILGTLMPQDWIEFEVAPD